MSITPLLQRFYLLPPSDHNFPAIDTNLDMTPSYFETEFGSARDAPRPGAPEMPRAIRRLPTGRACTHQTELPIPVAERTGWPPSNRSCARTFVTRHAASSAPDNAPGIERNHDCQARQDFAPLRRRPQALTFAPRPPHLLCGCRHNTVHLRIGGTQWKNSKQLLHNLPLPRR